MDRLNKILNGKALPETVSSDLENKQESYKLNCENIVGTIQIPLGLAGPIKYLSNEYIVPIATTEAALVASLNRGCKVLNLSKKLKVNVKKVGITRAPVYVVKRIKSEQFYKNWFKQNVVKLQEKIAESSRFTKIIDIKVKKYKGLLYVKFFFDTGDAMGMNMATIACQKMNEIICSELKAECVALSSNFCSDKKASLVNIIEGRGFKTLASVFISNEVISECLKCSSKELVRAYKAKIQNGSKLAKSISQNSHHANIIAGIFLATGQDAAHILESSLGSSFVKQENHGVTFKVEIPCLVIGTHGGGTGLPTQKEALDLIGLTETTESGSKSIELAKVISMAVLAGEISLLGSIAEGSLATAHDNFRKGKI